MPAAKAKLAGALIQQVQRTKSKAEAEVYADRLNELWPDIFVDFDDGLRVFYLKSHVSVIPRSLKFAATYIEEVYPDGSGRCVKDVGTRDRLGLRLPRASVHLSVFQSAPPPPPPPTRYEVLMLDEA